MPRGFVDRNAEIVAELGTWNALRLIFPEARRPLAREIDLRRRRNGRARDDEKNDGRDR